MSNDEGDIVEQPDMPSDLSDDNQMFTAEYRDGQLQIVEVTPCQKGVDNQIAYESEEILPDLGSSSDGEPKKYLQMLDTGNGLVQLDLLNFALVKGENGRNTYQMVSSDAATAANGDTTITCVLSRDDVDEDKESYVMLETDDDQDPYMYLQTINHAQETEETTTTQDHSPEQTPEPQTSNKPKTLTPVQILEKAKALQKTKAFLSSAGLLNRRQGRKRKSDLPPPMELLSSPNFKLYLYSCKQCSFKCNAIKEMSAHKKSEHTGCGAKGAGVRAACLQCAKCPYRGHTHTQLMKHVRDSHAKDTYEDTSENYSISAVHLDSEEVEAADVLVCGACGFESGDRALFRTHIEDEHGAAVSAL